MFQKPSLPALALCALFGLAACGDGDAQAASAVSQPRAAKVAVARNDGDRAHRPTAAEPITETDRLMLQAAATACQSPGSDGYAAFFDAFIRSDAVRRKYSARTISVISRSASTDTQTEEKLASADYHDFPIMMVDYYRKPVRPVRAGDRDEFVEVEFNQSQSNQISVEWTRVHYDGKSDGGDDLGNALDLDGQPYDPSRRTDGQLLFEPTGDCWELVADIRFER